jgi:hypothetical protein
MTPACHECAPANSELHHAEEWVSGHPIRGAAFANLKAPLPPVRAPIDPTDASEERKAAGRLRIAPYDNRKTTIRPARSS